MNKPNSVTVDFTTARRQWLALSCSAVTLAMGAQGANAQSTEGGSLLEEITVTATRREEVLSRVPISVTAITQEELDKKGIRVADDVFRLTPGVDFDRTGFGQQSFISIRGISSTAGAATTGVYIDDTPVQVGTVGFSSGNFYPALFDLERVEVLRGPQGTLFGASSEGGTIRFINARPSLEHSSGYVRAEIGSTERGELSYEAGVAAGGPLVDGKLGYRASAYTNRVGGFVDRIPQPAGLAGPTEASEDSNSSRVQALRAALLWQPTDRLTISPAFFYQEYNQDDSSGYWLTTPAGPLSDPSEQRYINGNGEAETSVDRLAIPSLQLEYDFGWANLVSNTAYLDREEVGEYDYRIFMNATFGLGADPLPTFATPGYFDHGHLTNNQQNFTQEVRLHSTDEGSRWRWVVGAFYSRAEQDASEILNTPYFDLTTGFPDRTFFCPPDVPDASVCFFGSPLVDGKYVYIDYNRTVSKELSGFADVTFKLTPTLSITGGVRVSKTELDFLLTRAAPGPGFGEDRGTQKESPVSPKVNISYQPTDDHLFYATVARGFRMGGVNRALPQNPQCTAALQAIGLSAAPQTYDHDEVTSYEIGTKNNLFGGRMRFALSAYHIDWQDIIQTVGLSTCGLSFTTNLADATSEGFDLEASLQPLNDLVITAAVGYNNTEFDQTIVDPAATSPLVKKGWTLGSAPWTVALSTEYGFTALTLDSYARADYTWRDNNDDLRAVTDPESASYDPLVPLNPATQNLDLRFGVRAGGWDVSAFIKNATNRHELLNVGHSSEGGRIFTASPVRPRTIGITVSNRF